MESTIELVEVNSKTSMLMHFVRQTIALNKHLDHNIQCSCNYTTRSFVKEYTSRLTGEKSSTCRTASKWLTYCTTPQDKEAGYLQILSTPFNTEDFEESEKQLELDLNRTFPDIAYFNIGSIGYYSLRRLLIAISKYFSSIGYVQGMNYIAGAILWHSTEYDAFWILVNLFEKYDLIDNFLPRLPGLFRHCRIIEVLTSETAPDLWLHLKERRIAVELYVTDWCMTLFCNLLPLSVLHLFFNGFFRQGWIYFYKVVMFIMIKKKSLILDATDITHILNIIKMTYRPCTKMQKFVKKFKRNNIGLSWSKLFKKAKKYKLDEDIVLELYVQYSTDCKSSRNIRWTLTPS